MYLHKKTFKPRQNLFFALHKRSAISLPEFDATKLLDTTPFAPTAGQLAGYAVRHEPGVQLVPSVTCCNYITFSLRFFK